MQTTLSLSVQATKTGHLGLGVKRVKVALFLTEFKKVRTCPSSTEAQLRSVSEDHLIDELAKQKVMLPGDERDKALWVWGGRKCPVNGLFTVCHKYYQVGVVRKLCRACNIDTKGSRLDLITKLKENMKSRQTYDKVFQIWGASGTLRCCSVSHDIKLYIIHFTIYWIFNLRWMVCNTLPPWHWIQHQT